MRTELKITHAHSMNSGILFYSKRHKDYVTIATTDEYGNITTEWTTLKKYKKNKSKEEKIIETKKMFILYILVLPFVIILFTLTEWLTNQNPIWGTRALQLGLSLLFLFSFIITSSYERKEERNAYKFHSAEHMVLNAYRKLKRVPSIEEIYQFSQFSNSCGTNTTTLLVIFFALSFICSFISNSSYRLLVLILADLLVLILLQRGFLNFLQKFTTIKPTDKELAVAIAGMNAWLENEKKEKKETNFFKFLRRLFPKVFN